MTSTLDANILVFAADQSSSRQDRARRLLDWATKGPQVVHFFWPALLGFIRIATHPSVLSRPLSPETAEGAVERLVRRPHVRVDSEMDEFWDAYRRAGDGVSPRGNLVSDAHLVALMHQHGVTTIWTHDRDFRKFEGITVKDPFSARYSAGFG